MAKKGFADFWRDVFVEALGGVISFILISAILSGLFFTFFRGLGRELYQGVRGVAKKISDTSH